MLCWSAITACTSELSPPSLLPIHALSQPAFERQNAAERRLPPMPELARKAHFFSCLIRALTRKRNGGRQIRWLRTKKAAPATAELQPGGGWTAGGRARERMVVGVSSVSGGRVHEDEDHVSVECSEGCGRAL
eukprot:3277380-Rhodomonas_salina.2